MHPLFHIKKEDIQSLDDVQARELVTRLCKAELSSRNLDVNVITSGGDQRATDGGVDVRVDLDTKKEITGYVPNPSTVFQVKAEIFNSAKIKGEMAPKGQIRPAIIELADRKGAYIIVSTKDNVSDTSLTARRKAMRDCLTLYKLDDQVQIDFYDCQRLADWSEKHPSVVVWLRSLSKKPMDGWRPYAPWAYREDSTDSEYIIDDKIKVFVPESDEGVPVLEAINSLRNDLNKHSASVRIVGLSGVGKTRLLQALFDARIITENNALTKEKVLYTDISDNSTIQPSTMLEGLYLDKIDSIVIVDNCGQAEHRKLTEIAKRSGSRICLVTVEYDIRDDLPDDTICYRLEGSSMEVIKQLLKRNNQELSNLDVDKIVEFSDGNARVAYALASTSESKGQLARLRDDELFTRLFHQNHTENDDLLRCASVASLLYSFDSEDISVTSELATLASLAEVSISSFLRNIAELQRRGLVQERGKWKAILPHAISNKLANRALDEYPIQLLTQKFFTDISLRITRSFAHRLSFMHESENAKKIVSNALQPHGLLPDLSKMDEMAIRVLENIAPVNQRAILDALIATLDKNETTVIESNSRSNFFRLLRHLAYEVELFDGAVGALVQIILKEQSDPSNEAKEILASLFFAQLSGTMAPPNQRIKIIESLLSSGNDAENELGLSLLRSGLEASHFSSHYGFDFGALKRTYGWYPSTYQEHLDWYVPFIELSVEAGLNQTSVGVNARALLGANIRTLWGDPKINETLKDAAEKLSNVDGWPDGWLGVRMTLSLDKDVHKDASLEMLMVLEKRLAPIDLMSKIQAKILSRGNYGVELEYEPDDRLGIDEDNHNALVLCYKVQKEAEFLGKAAVANTEVLEDISIYLKGSNYGNKAYHFGKGVGKEHPSITSLLKRVKSAINTLDVEHIRFNFAIVEGIIAGWNEVNPDQTSKFLDEALSDEVWGKYFTYLQFSIQLQKEDVNRLSKSLDLDIAPCIQYEILANGRKSDQLTSQQTIELLNKLAKKSDGGINVVLDILFMIVYGSKDRDEEYNADLRKFCVRLISELGWAQLNLSNSNFVHQIAEIVQYSIAKDIPESAAILILENLTTQQIGKFLVSRVGEIISPFVEIFPKATLNILIRYDDQVDISRLTKIDYRKSSAIEKIDPDILIEWCLESPIDRCEFAASLCKLFERPNDNISDSTVLGIASPAQKLLEIAPDKNKILKIFMSRYTPNNWSGSRSVIMKQRLELIDQLNLNADTELKKLIDVIKNDYKAAIAREEKHEQEYERLQVGSFET